LSGVFLKDYCVGLHTGSDELFCTLCIQDKKYPPKDFKRDENLAAHLASDHFPIDWEKYSVLCFPSNLSS